MIMGWSSGLNWMGMNCKCDGVLAVVPGCFFMTIHFAVLCFAFQPLKEVSPTTSMRKRWVGFSD